MIPGKHLPALMAGFLFLSGLHAQNRGYLMLNPATSVCQSTTLRNFQDFFLDNEVTLITKNNENSIRTYLKENGLESYLRLAMAEADPEDLRPLLFSEFRIKRNDTLLSKYNVCKITSIADIKKLEMEMAHLLRTEKIPDTLQGFSFIDFDICPSSLVLRRFPEASLHLRDKSNTWHTLRFESIPYRQFIEVLFSTEKERNEYLGYYEIVRKEFKKFIDIESFYLSEELIIAGLQVYVPNYSNGKYLLNPYHVLAVYNAETGHMEILGVNSSILISGSEFSAGFRGGFTRPAPGKLFIPIESYGGNSKYFLGRFNQDGRRFEFRSNFEMELPEFFQSKNLGYNFNDKLFSGDYMLFKWSSDLYNLKSGKHIALEPAAMDNEPGVSSDVPFFVTSFRAGPDHIELMAIVNNYYEYRQYDREGKMLDSIIYPITYRDYCSYPVFHGKDQFALINCEKNQLEIYSIRKAGN